LVGGETHLEDLLANTLPPEISTELVQCERAEDIHSLLVQLCGPPGENGTPWQIHPAIVARIHRASPDYAVYFAQWSALLDNAALAVITAAALQANENPQAPVVLAEYLDPKGPQAIADLSRLRAQLIEDRLAESGVDRGRVTRETRSVSDVPGMTQESQRVDIVVRPA
jgi:outer membrane protein OmpA-like peptidoglycan-associated protein